MIVTENFNEEDFACKCGCGFNVINTGIVHRLQVVRDIAGVPILVLSGCRCVKHNKNEGGADDSKHLIGEAVDWCFIDGPDGLLEKMCTKLLQNWSGGFKYYKKKKFCHADIGRKRRW